MPIHPSTRLLAPDATDPAGGDVPPSDSGMTAPADGIVLDQNIERELKDSYLTYAMSTIMDRALPDVRDGLKPSQRRILVAMNDLNLRPGKKHYKCAKITGDTSGNYHPHGDQVIYPTLVGMAQKWRMRVPLVDPQGNFGSINGDPPAAARYTEARMTHAAVDMLADLKLDTVDFQPNYDDRLMEPTVLPGKFPNLLINGTTGIAVGMATSLAPHNPAEILDAIVRVVKNPEIQLADLMKDEGQTVGSGDALRLGVKGPDFPTGGIIHGRQGIVEAYATGRGKVTLRGRCHTEDISKDKVQIVIDEIPYNLSLSTLVERIVDAVRDERITEIADVRDETNREVSCRVVVELKRGADPAVIENQLYQFTPLQQTFSIMNIALVNRQPRTLSLKEMIERYIEHRRIVIRRRTAYLLREAKKRGHVLEGMIYAVCDLDEVIRIIRASRTRDEAIERLMEKKFQIPAGHKFAPLLPKRLLDFVRSQDPAGGVALSRIQAETIGNMRLIQLTGLEIEKLTQEYAEVVREIEGYEEILSKPALVDGMIVADCDEMKAKYGSGKAAERLTTIEDAGGDINIASLIRVEDVAVTISHAGYAKRVPLETYKQQGRGGKGIIAGKTKDDDFIERMFVASTHDDLLVFTDTGRVFAIKVYELPEMDRTAKGRALVQFISFKPGEKARAFLAIKDFESGSNYLTFVSRKGLVKRTALKAYMNVNTSGIIAVDIREGDALLDVALTSGSDDLLIATASGMAIRFPETDARDMGRAAGGVKAIELEDGDQTVGLVVIPMKPDPKDPEITHTVDPSLSLLTICENGYGKRTAVDEYRVQPEAGPMRSQSRGGKGRADIKTTDRNGKSIAAVGVRDSDDVVVVSKGGQLVRMAAASISQYGRGTQGVRIVSLHEGDQVATVAGVPSESNGSEPTSTGTQSTQPGE